MKASRTGSPAMLAALAGAALTLGSVTVALGQAGSTDNPDPIKPAARRSLPPGVNDYTVNYDLGRYGGGTLSQPARGQTSRPTSSSSPASSRGVPEASTGLERQALRNGPGTIGFSSGSGLNPGQLHDGRSAPGLERYNQDNNGGYAGMSISVPTLRNTLVPANSPWGPPL